MQRIILLLSIDFTIPINQSDTLLLDYYVLNVVCSGDYGLTEMIGEKLLMKSHIVN